MTEAYLGPKALFREPSDEELLRTRIHAVTSDVVAPLIEEGGYNFMQEKTLHRLQAGMDSDQVVDGPTRSGKSFLLQRIAVRAAECGLRVAILTHTTLSRDEHLRELEEQGAVVASLYGEDESLVTVDTLARLRINASEDTLADTDKVDLVLLDETHRAYGEVTRPAVRNAFPSAPRISFTATPDYADDRSITDEYGEKIVSHSPLEGIEGGLSSPLRVFVHQTDGIIDDFDPGWKDFSPRELRRLANYLARNEVIVDYTQDLVNDGRQGIIRTIPGENLLHADQLKEMIEQRVITNPDGTTRPIRAAVVGGTGRNTEQALQEFEDGYVDVLLFCKLIGESWTSHQASFFINGCPTTSIVDLTQAVGRIGELKGFEGVAIDLIDQSLGKKQRTLLDVYEMDRSVQGVLLGTPSETDIDPSGPDGRRNRETYFGALFRSSLSKKLAQIDDRKIAELLYTAKERKELSPYHRRLRDFRDQQRREFRTQQRRYDSVLRKEGLGPQPDYFGRIAARLGNHTSIEPVIDEDTVKPWIIDGIDGKHPLIQDNGAVEIRWQRGYNEADFVWLGASVNKQIILPVIPAPDVIESWEISDMSGARDEALASAAELDDEIERMEIKNSVRRALKGDNITDRERGIIARLHGLDGWWPETLEEVGEEFGVGRERIRQISEKVKVKLEDSRHLAWHPQSPSSRKRDQVIELRERVDYSYVPPKHTTHVAGSTQEKRVASERIKDRFFQLYEKEAEPATQIVSDILGADFYRGMYSSEITARLAKFVTDYVVEKLVSVGISSFSQNRIHLGLAESVMGTIRTHMRYPGEKVGATIDDARQFADTYYRNVQPRYQDGDWLEQQVIKRLVGPFVTGAMLERASSNAARIAKRSSQTASNASDQ